MVETITTTVNDSLQNIAQIRSIVDDLIKIRENDAHTNTIIPGVPDVITSFIITAAVAGLVRFLEKSMDKIIQYINKSTQKP